MPGNRRTRRRRSRLPAQFPGFVHGADPIQPRRTMVVSLEGSEEDWLARMKQKTRYNIRLAEKKEVVVRVPANPRIWRRFTS